MQAFGRYLLGLSRDLNRVLDLDGLVRCAHGAVLARTGYRSCWLYIVEPGGDVARLLAIFGTAAGLVLDEVERLPVDGDPMLREIFRGTEPVVVHDARTDPRTDKRLVGLIGNRTIVNVPLVLDAEHVGALGVGTFGDEGVRPPTFDELDELGAIAAQVAGVAGRLREQVARREAEELLHRTQRMESIGRLASGVAHDFNNVLHVILGQTEQLADEVGPEAGVRVQTIRQAGERAARLTGQLLALGRRSVGAPEPLEVGEALADLAGLLRRTVPSTVEITLDVAPDLPPVHLDLAQLEQLVLNLVGNARDALPDEGGTIAVRVSLARPEAGDQLLLEVADTGVGMPREVLSRVMEPYFTTKHAGRGTGLGLPVVRAIVDQHGGQVELSSAEGQGTTVRVVLPVRVHVEEPVSDEAGRGHGEQILVVDDDASVREMLREVLRFGGYQVSVVADGSAALDLIRTGPVDLVVSDLVVPGVDGPAMLVAARQHAQRLPFVFLEGQDANGAATAVHGHEHVQVLPKPFALKQLLRSMRAALG